VSFAVSAPFGMVTTQTCDLALEGGGKPTTAWVQLAPVFNGEAPHPLDPTKHLLRGDVRKLVRDGRGSQNLLYIPDAPDDGFWFADLSFEVPVERGWLARRDRIEGFGDESKREEVGRRLAWLRSRPALDGRFVGAVQVPIVNALRELRKDDTDAYDNMAQVVLEVGFAMNSRLDVGVARLCVFHDGATDEQLEWWRDLWTTELHPGAEAHGFNLLPLQVESIYGPMTIAEYRSFTRLPLTTISPYPEWFGADPTETGA